MAGKQLSNYKKDNFLRQRDTLRIARHVLDDQEALQAMLFFLEAPRRPLRM